VARLKGFQHLSMADPFDPTGLTALVFDENHYERGISLNQLRTMGFGRAIGAAHSGEAWDGLRRQSPHIMLVEWIEGADTLDFIRHLPLSEELPNPDLSIL